MKLNLEIIPVDLLRRYCGRVKKTKRTAFEKLHDSELSIKTFSFYTSVSAVYSSKIEGENIELDSFINYKRQGVKLKSDYTRKIDDLYNSYLLAQKKKLTPANINMAHALLTKHILQKTKQGTARKGNMFVVTRDGKIEYVAALPFHVPKELNKLYADIKQLLSTELTFNEVLYFASMIHLMFVKIHPFEDGNGRTARLLEKWFMAKKLGAKAWFVQSEKYYYKKHKTYYNNIRSLGMEYETLDYSKALPFLFMLPEAISYKD
ncbi:MAG: Fic family protein [Bacteroidetes bacterium]|nr:Fic family protein [Bacteroidota bacterium]